MAQGVQDWSLTASSNGSADANINFAEGQSPPSLNNSARALMAAVRAFYNAIGGGISYGGSSNAYTATNSSPGTWTAYAEGQIIGLEANPTNTGAATINVDSLGTKSIVKGASTALAAGDIVSGGYYLLRYDGTNFQVIGGAGGGSYQPLDATLTALAALSYTSGTLYLTMTAADTFALADDATLVKTTGAQTIAGTKTFTGPLLYVRAAFAAVGILSNTDGTGRGVRESCNGATSASIIEQATTDSFSSVTTVSTLDASTGVRNYSVAPTINSSAINVAGKQSIPVPASAMVARTTNGAATGTSETATNRIMLRSLDFDASTDEFVQFTIPRMPKSWNESTITARFIWTATNTGNVVWGIQAVAISDDDALDAAFGTAQTVTDGVTAANDVMHSAETSAVTIAGTPAEGDMVVFQVYRDADNGSDTCAVDAKLIGVELFISTNAANDA